MVNEIKTLEQIQEEYKKIIGEIANNDIIKEDLPKPIVETPIEKVVVEKTKEEIPSDAPKLILKEDTDSYEEEDGLAENLSVELKPIKQHRLLRFITGVIIILCSVGFVLGGVIFAIGKNTDKAFFGYGFYPVSGTDMSPVYNVGDMVLYRDLNIEKVVDTAKEGSILVAYTENNRKEISVGRVVSLEKDEKTGDIYYNIKGDNPNADTLKAHARLVLGVAENYPLKWFAYAVNFVTEHTLYLILGFILPLFICIVIRAFLGPKKRKEDIEYFEDLDEKK